MTDREKVMQWIKICANGCEDGCPYEYKNLVHRVECKADLMSDALELLKEQEPIKPTVAVDTWICSKCGHRLESQDLIDDKENPQVLVHELYQYCPNCGRAVKWND